MKKNILEYLEERELGQPEKIAVVDKSGNSISFKELAVKSRQVGTFLARKEIYNKPIPVFTNQSIDSLILFFGILYSGNYYVPIDVATPNERIKLIFENCQASISCGGGKLNYSFSAYYTLDEMLVETDEDLLKAIRNKHKADNPLYMVYTSGSTGIPKGVLKSHGSMIYFIEKFVETFSITEEVIANQTPFYFDASAKDIYLMLKTGSTMHIVPKELFMFPVKLIEFLNQRKITYICWVPSALGILSQLNAFKNSKLEYVRNVFFVGEVMQIKHLNYWREHLPNARYVNLYGSSEMSGICCYYEIKKQFDLESALPIGKPLNGIDVFLSGEVCLDGEHTGEKIGEICVRSPSLAICYFADPEKTNKVFTTDENSTIVLHTGDLGKYDNEGNIVYVSRKDFQIKHMGHRIELCEIETYLNAIDFIDTSCCVYDEKADKIISFFTAHGNIEDYSKTIINLLKAKLPAYMIPNKYIKLDSMPSNKNGKIDRVLLKKTIQ